MSYAIDPRQQHANRMFPRHIDAVARLTERQREIIELLSRPGARRSVTSVATELGISVQTAKNHLTSAYRTLGVYSLGQAVRVILDRRAVEP